MQEIGDVAISSAIEWNAQDWGPSGDYCAAGVDPYCEFSGSGGGGGGLPPVYPTSIFMDDMGWLRKTLVTLGADAVGAGGAAAMHWYTAAGGPATYGGVAAIGGITASAGTAIGFLAN